MSRARGCPPPLAALLTSTASRSQLFQKQRFAACGCQGLRSRAVTIAFDQFGKTLVSYRAVANNTSTTQNLVAMKRWTTAHSTSLRRERCAPPATPASSRRITAISTNLMTKAAELPVSPGRRRRLGRICPSSRACVLRLDHVQTQPGLRGVGAIWHVRVLRLRASGESGIV